MHSLIIIPLIGKAVLFLVSRKLIQLKQTKSWNLGDPVSP